MTEKAMTPKSLHEAAMIVFLQLRSITEGRVIAGFGQSLAAEQLHAPDPLEIVTLINLLRLAGDREAAKQLLEAISLIVVAGGWRAVLDDPDANKGWARAMRSLG